MVCKRVCDAEKQANALVAIDRRESRTELGMYNSHKGVVSLSLLRRKKGAEKKRKKKEWLFITTYLLGLGNYSGCPIPPQLFTLFLFLFFSIATRQMMV
jgi:hypothetical protein